MQLKYLQSIYKFIVHKTLNTANICSDMAIAKQQTQTQNHFEETKDCLTAL